MAKLLDKFNKRKQRVRTALKRNSKGKLRLSVYRSNLHIYAQIIDDMKGITIASASTKDSELSKAIKKTSNVDAAKLIGTEVAKRAISKKVKEVVFDRGGYIYHGRVKALADAAREAGLKF
ncbi:MAG: 50S ribosomal protein L18 [Alphaproteobacteria bacterium]|jgi:large subunit ribosomal protein L18|nr:50S ribosomal protein L18 [Candidatus Jidaibacter sp.]